VSELDVMCREERQKSLPAALCGAALAWGVLVVMEGATAAGVLPSAHTVVSSIVCVVTLYWKISM
jgi:hypothetical protein